MKADEIVQAARALVGTPFKHQGRIPGKALDCAGLASVVVSNWYQTQEPIAYSRIPRDNKLREWIEKQDFIQKVPNQEMQAGDIILMRFRTEPQHVAICAGQNIIHSYESIGRVVEHILDDRWKSRIVSVYRLKDVEA